MIDCGIGDEGAKRIGEMLEKNESLVEIINLSLLDTTTNVIAI
jgi:hypothetical protein